jgi:hypothetical protein
MESLFFSAYNPLKSAISATVSKAILAIPELAANEINYYAIGIFLSATAALFLYYALMIPLKHIAPNKFEHTTQIFFTRLVWSILGLFQVR